MTRSQKSLPVTVRALTEQDIPAVSALSHRVYGEQGWQPDHLRSHLAVFPEGQLVAVLPEDGQVVGNAASLVVNWDDYEFGADENDFTDRGYFRNHGSEGGRTLYGADVCVSPDHRGRGIGKAIYKARRELCRRLQLKRIRAAARLRGYAKYARSLSPEAYTKAVIAGDLIDPTLSFQLHEGFRVLAVVRHHLGPDAESLGHAAIIEWVNHQAALRTDWRGRYRAKPRQFARHRHEKPGENPSS